MKFDCQQKFASERHLTHVCLPAGLAFLAQPQVKARRWNHRALHRAQDRPLEAHWLTCKLISQISVARPPKVDEASRVALHSFLGRIPPDEADVTAAMKSHLSAGAAQPADGWYGISVAQALATKRKAEWSGKSSVQLSERISTYTSTPLTVAPYPTFAGTGRRGTTIMLYRRC